MAKLDGSLKIICADAMLFFCAFSNRLEKTSDAVIKAGKTGDLGLVSGGNCRVLLTCN